MGRSAGLLSGGEQQMLSLARALGREPRVLLADELSLGLAPMVVDRLLTSVRQAADERGVAVLLVEQHVRQALRFADRVYVLERGRVALTGPVAEVRAPGHRHRGRLPVGRREPLTPAPRPCHHRST